MIFYTLKIILNKSHLSNFYHLPHIKIHYFSSHCPAVFEVKFSSIIAFKIINDYLRKLRAILKDFEWIRRHQ